MKRPTKYGNRKTTVDGLTFDSAREARRWAELRLLERAGEITDLERQVRIRLIGADGEPIRFRPSNRPATYVADFTYRDRSGREVIEDAKGFETPEFRLKRAVLAAQGVEVVTV